MISGPTRSTKDTHKLLIYRRNPEFIYRSLNSSPASLIEVSKPVSLITSLAQKSYYCISAQDANFYAIDIAPHDPALCFGCGTEAQHLTKSPMSSGLIESFATLISTMHRLRAPGGCPWDAEQTHASLKPYVLEEAHELCDAIDGGEDGELRDELGDLLLQVVFHAELAAERGAFSIADVVEGLVAKLVRRHPHVFGDEQATTSADVKANWSRIKARERAATGGIAKPTGALTGVPRGLPALLRSHRLGERAAAVGFDWPNAAAARAKINEEIGELDEAVVAGDSAAVVAELGDMLFAASSYARLLEINGEMALQSALDRFERRFRAIEAEYAERGEALEDASLEALDQAWQRAKASTALSDAAVPTIPRRES